MPPTDPWNQPIQYNEPEDPKAPASAPDLDLRTGSASSDEFPAGPDEDDELDEHLDAEEDEEGMDPDLDP